VLIAPDEVLTVSHAVYISGVGTASDIAVSADYDDGSAPDGSSAGTYIHYLTVQDANGTITNQQSQYDYAVIHLDTPFDVGTMALDSNFQGGAVDVTGYPAWAGGVLVNNPEQVSVNPQYSLLEGTSIGPGSSGGPVWVIGSDGMPEIVGLISSSTGSSVGGQGNFVQLTSADVANIDAWVAADDGLSPGALAVEDTTNNTAQPPYATSYDGPVAGLHNEYVNITADNLNITATTPGWFLHSGSGNDGLAVTSGDNVLDGGTGSNFLTGGSGADTFFVDDRGASTDIWSTVVNFHAGDSATIWGVDPTDFLIGLWNNEGATGYTGLTLRAEAAGKPTASVTLAGFSIADTLNGHISLTYGTDSASGSSYAYLHAN
jgi:V8-like Glu-specific endopeptidase